MNVVWKRPDGFHGATPEDFVVIDLAGHSNLWLHTRDKDSFPFRISGGWEEEVATTRLNNLINLLKDNSKEWVSYLVKSYDHSPKDSAAEFFTELHKWLLDLKNYLKGNKWEIEIMTKALDMVATKLVEVKAAFLKEAK